MERLHFPLALHENYPKAECSETMALRPLHLTQFAGLKTHNYFYIINVTGFAVNAAFVVWYAEA